MTNVVAFQRPPAPNGSPDLLSWLEIMDRNAAEAHRLIERARNRDTALRYYADWLRKYYEADGCLKNAFRLLENGIKSLGDRRQNGYLDWLVENLAEVEEIVKGRMPWLATSPEAFKRLACRNLEKICIELHSAELSARAIAGLPKGGA